MDIPLCSGRGHESGLPLDVDIPIHDAHEKTHGKRLAVIGGGELLGGAGLVASSTTATVHLPFEGAIS